MLSNINKAVRYQQPPNKALHPTAYSLRSFARASLRRSGFRRRVSLVVVQTRKHGGNYGELGV
jgi:hypothetical protein